MLYGGGFLVSSNWIAYNFGGDDYYGMHGYYAQTIGCSGSVVWGWCSYE